MKHTPGSPGFTLVEIMVALAIMAVGLFAVFRLQAQNLDLQSEACFMTQAGQLAKERMAEIQARSDWSEGISSGDFRERQLGFLYGEDVSRVDGIQNLFRIRVTVREEGDRTGRSYTVETFQWSNTP